MFDLLTFLVVVSHYSLATCSNGKLTWPEAGKEKHLPTVHFCLGYWNTSMGVHAEDFKVLRWNILNHTFVAAVPQYVRCKIGLIPNRTSHLFTRSSRNLPRQRWGWMFIVQSIGFTEQEAKMVLQDPVELWASTNLMIGATIIPKYSQYIKYGAAFDILMYLGNEPTCSLKHLDARHFECSTGSGRVWFYWFRTTDRKSITSAPGLIAVTFTVVGSDSWIHG